MEGNEIPSLVTLGKIDTISKKGTGTVKLTLDGVTAAAKLSDQSVM